MDDVTRAIDYLVVGDTSPLYVAGSAGTKLIQAVRKNSEMATFAGSRATSSSRWSRGPERAARAGRHRRRLRRRWRT